MISFMLFFLPISSLTNHLCVYICIKSQNKPNKQNRSAHLGSIFYTLMNNIYFWSEFTPNNCSLFFWWWKLIKKNLKSEYENSPLSRYYQPIFIHFNSNILPNFYSKIRNKFPTFSIFPKHSEGEWFVHENASLVSPFEFNQLWQWANLTRICVNSLNNDEPSDWGGFFGILKRNMTSIDNN